MGITLIIQLIFVVVAILQSFVYVSQVLKGLSAAGLISGALRVINALLIFKLSLFFLMMSFFLTLVGATPSVVM